jgi:2,4-dienoyl-CoA reductase-like NADH-dependent reductase (Old Yellow Enzyme family)
MSRLFQPLLVGPVTLQHRVAMAPLTRYRWGDDWDATGMKDMIIGMLKCIGLRCVSILDC